MKMKSFFSGINAKLALAVLAVGTMFTSCYDSENGDVTVNRPTPAEYLIVGNVTDGRTGEAITTAQYTINDGKATNVDANGSFTVQGLSAGSYVVKVTASGYKDAVRTIYLAETNNGGQCVGNADFVLYGIDDEDLIVPDDPEKPTGVPATEEQAKAVVTENEEAIKADFAAMGISEVNITTDEDGKTTLKAEATNVEGVAEGEDARGVVAPYYMGFASTIPLDMTKAITFDQLWNASAESALGMSYGLKNVTRTVTLKGEAGKVISGYTVTINFDSRVLSFDGVEGTVLYQGSEDGTWKIEPLFDSHDSHDGHNTHGDGNGFGGGSSF